MEAERPPILLVMMLPLFIGWGSFMLIGLTPNAICEFDQKNKQVTVRLQAQIWAKEQTCDIPIHEIQEIIITKSIKNGELAGFHVLLQLTNNPKQELFNIDYPYGLRTTQRSADLVRSLLELRPKARTSPDPPSSGSRVW